MPRLVVKGGAQAGEQFGLGPENYVGALMGKIRFSTAGSLGGKEIFIQKAGDGYVMRRFDRSLPVLLNGNPVEVSILNDGDLISLADLSVVFQDQDADAPKPGAPARHPAAAPAKAAPAAVEAKPAAPPPAPTAPAEARLPGGATGVDEDLARAREALANDPALSLAKSLQAIEKCLRGLHRERVTEAGEKSLADVFEDLLRWEAVAGKVLALCRAVKEVQDTASAPPPKTAAPSRAEAEIALLVARLLRDDCAARVAAAAPEEAGEAIHGLVLPRLMTEDRREKAARLIAEIKGIPLAEALKLTEKPIIHVLKGVTLAEAERQAERFQKAHIPVRVTTRQRGEAQA